MCATVRPWEKGLCCRFGVQGGRLKKIKFPMWKLTEDFASLIPNYCYSILIFYQY